MMKLLTEDQLAKLPKYAQESYNALARRVAELEAELQDDIDSADVMVRSRNGDFYHDRVSEVKFYIDPEKGEGNWISVKPDGDLRNPDWSTLQISTRDGSLLVKPWVTNVIHLASDFQKKG